MVSETKKKAIHVVINERAGAVVARGGHEVHKMMEDAFIKGKDTEHRIHLVAPENLGAVVRDCMKENPEAIIVGGGDGSIVTVASILRGTSTALGVIPLGTFNMFARDIEVPLDLPHAVQALRETEVREVDVAEVNGHPFLCACVMGFYTSILNDAEFRGKPWWVKVCSLSHRTIKSFSRYPTLNITLETEQGSHYIRTRFAAVTNNAYRDEPGMIPHKASLGSGKLAVYVSAHTRIWDVMKSSAAFAMGRLGEDKSVTITETSKLEIKGKRRRKVVLLLDGEKLSERLPLHFEMFPRALKVLIPKTTSPPSDE